MKDYLSVIITDGDHEWQQQCIAIPRVGDHITCRREGSLEKVFGGEVDHVHWEVREGRPGMIVTVWLKSEAPPPQTNVAARWLPIAQADKTINHVTEFTQIGLTLKNSDTFWVRDEDGRIYKAAWSEGNNGRDYWWDWEGESPVDPVEFMPHPLDPRWSATPEGSTP